MWTFLKAKVKCSGFSEGRRDINGKEAQNKSSLQKSLNPFLYMMPRDFGPLCFISCVPAFGPSLL